jgi:hypothetical protein
MLYLVVETFRDGDPLPVYRRFRDRGGLPQTACDMSRAGLRTTCVATIRLWSATTDRCSRSGWPRGRI